MSLVALRAAVAAWSPQVRDGGDPLGWLASSWAELVGEGIAEHSRPLSIAGDTLLVATRSGAWSQQLSLLGDDLLDRLRALPDLQGIRRLRFRVGYVRPGGRRGPGAVRRKRRSAPDALAPLPDDATAMHALERLRRRLLSRGLAGPACPRCGAPRQDAGACAPCQDSTFARRAAATERLMYDAPWLGYIGIAALVPGLDRGQYEACRGRLLGRWWQLLTRCRYTKCVTVTERRVASSYVLLHSELEPDRITPAVVRNLLGDELAALLDRTERNR